MDSLACSVSIEPALLCSLKALIHGSGAFLVYPTTMLYPQTLIYVNLFDVLHRGKGELLQGKRYVHRFCWTLWDVV